jgi:hypothetical protein
VTSGLSEEKLQEFREIFSFFDRWGHPGSGHPDFLTKDR